MNLNELLNTVMNQYTVESEKPYAGNHLANTIRHGLEEAAGEDLISSTMLFKGSAGISQWAKVPWMGIFDEDISKGASSGIGIVYLLSYSSDYIYLSLDQSWTYYKNKYKKDAPEKIKLVSKVIQKELTSISNRMSAEPIDLIEGGKASTYPRGYELGNVVSIKYDKSNLPDNSELLVDLRDMVKVLEELKIKLGKIDSEYNIDSFIK